MKSLGLLSFLVVMELIDGSGVHMLLEIGIPVLLVKAAANAIRRLLSC